MDHSGLIRYRKVWQNDRQRGSFTALAYYWSDRMGITRLVHKWLFPCRNTIARVAHYLDSSEPNWRDEVQDCYFGHTHMPFSKVAYDGVTFHNTG